MNRSDNAAHPARRSAYVLRGRYAARRSFDIPTELLAPREPEQPRYAEVPRWFSAAGFAAISSVMIFCMCAVGRQGA